MSKQVTKVLSKNNIPTEVKIGLNQAGFTDSDVWRATKYLYADLAGIGKFEVNGNSVNIDINDQLVATTGGLGVIVSTTDATPQYVGAIALEPSTADGDIISVLIVGPFPIVKGTA